MAKSNPASENRGRNRSDAPAAEGVEIVYMNPEELIPYINNTKKHPKEQIDLLVSSMKEFKFDVPIVVDKDLVIIKGHARREAALQGKLEKVPVIIRGDLTPAQVKAARIADNKLAESEWDYDMLKIEMESLKEIGVDLSFTGFDSSVINALLDSHDNFSFDDDDGGYVGETVRDDDGDDDGDSPSDYQDVTGSMDGKSWMVMFSFGEKDKAEEFCRLLQVEDADFVKGSQSKTIDGDKLDFDAVFGTEDLEDDD